MYGIKNNTGIIGNKTNMFIRNASLGFPTEDITNYTQCKPWEGKTKGTNIYRELLYGIICYLF